MWANRNLRMLPVSHFESSSLAFPERSEESVSVRLSISVLLRWSDRETISRLFTHEQLGGRVQSDLPWSELLICSYLEQVCEATFLDSTRVFYQEKNTVSAESREMIHPSILLERVNALYRYSKGMFLKNDQTTKIETMAMIVILWKYFRSEYRSFDRLLCTTSCL